MFHVDISLFETKGSFLGQKPMGDYNMPVLVSQLAPLNYLFFIKKIQNR